MLQKQVSQDAIIILDLPRPSKEIFLSPNNGNSRTARSQMRFVRDLKDIVQRRNKLKASAAEGKGQVDLDSMR